MMNQHTDECDVSDREHMEAADDELFLMEFLKDASTATTVLG